MSERKGDALATKSDVQALRADVQTDMQALRADMQALRTEMKTDMQALRADVKTDMQVLRAEIRADAEALETRLVERLLEVSNNAETRLLNAFYGYAQTHQKRMVLLEGTDGNVLSRLGTVESRVLKIEKRLNMPPAA